MPGRTFELLIATRNTGKIQELVKSFLGLTITIRLLSEFESVTEVDEVGTTYEENATLKAVSYACQTGITALADDSGLEVDALNGQPGVSSARFGSTTISDADRMQLLLEALAHVEPSQRTARFVCSMVLFGKPFTKPSASEARILAATEGVCEGTIATSTLGNHGFGFDPIFIPAGYILPFAALDSSIKASISHRAKAARQMRLVLEDIISQT